MTPRPEKSSETRLGVMFAGLFLISQFPLYLSRYPGILDFPNHLARLHALTALDRVAALGAHYEFAPGVFPNMAMDLLVPLLSSVLGLELGLKAFVTLGSLSLAAGTLALARALTGHVNLLVLGIPLLLNGAMLQYGLLNFLLGTGAALLLCARWISLRRRGTPSPWALVSQAVGVTALYVCHLSALGTYLVMVLAFEMFRRVREARPERALTSLISVILPILPATLIHYALFEPGMNATSPDPSHSTLVELLLRKLLLLLALPGLMLPPSLVPLILVSVSVAVLFVALASRGCLSIEARGAWIAAALAFAMTVLPSTGFGSMLVDARMIVPLSLVLMASIRIRAAALPMRRAVVAVLASCVVISNVALALEWRASSEEQQELRERMLAFESGSKVAVIRLHDLTPGTLSAHAATLSVLDRSTLVSSLFARPFTPFLLAYKPHVVEAIRPVRQDLSTRPPPLGELSDHWDYAVIFGTREQLATYLDHGDKLAESSGWSIVRLRPTSAS